MLKSGKKSIGEINPSSNNLFQIDTNNNTDMILESLANQIGDLLENFYFQEFSYLQQKLDSSLRFYQGIVNDIYNFVIPPYITFNIRALFFNIVDGLKQYVNTAQHCAIVEMENIELEKKTAILNDYQKVKSYIENMYKNLTRQFVIFEFQPITTIIPKIHPKYLKYYELYGRPVNGVYKSELMKNVELLLKNDMNKDNI